MWRGILKVIDATVPVGNLAWWCWRLRRRATGRSRSSPLRSGRCANAWSLVGLWVNILWNWRRSAALCLSLCLALEELQAGLDVNVCRVQISRATICIQCIGSLVVTRLVQRTKVIPYFRDVRIEPDGTGIGVKSIAILVDLVVEHTN
jgi:hypothetical protein